MDVFPDTFPVTPEVLRIGKAVRKAGGYPILVGGWVRDVLLQAPHSKDFDLEVFALAPRKLQNLLRTFGPVQTVGRHFGVLKLTTPEAEYDISIPRRESKIGKGHKDFHVEPDPDMTFEEAAARRDFTINAVGYDFLARKVLDFFDGTGDVKRRCLRHVGPAFGEDPLRVLRALQFAGRFELTIAPETLAICREQDLSHLPRERIWEELKKLFLLAEYPSRGLAYAEPLGVLPYFPELERLATAPDSQNRSAPSDWELTWAVMDRAAALRSGDPKRDLALMMGALCHRLRPGGSEAEAEAMGAAQRPEPGRGAPPFAAEGAVRALMARVTRETALPETVVTLVRDLDTPERLHAQPGAACDPALRRLALRVDIPALLQLARARHEGGEAPSTPFAAGEWLAERARQLGVYDGPPEPMLKGRHLLELGERPGPRMGELLKSAFQMQLDGKIGSLEEARAMARRELSLPAAPGAAD